MHKKFKIDESVNFIERTLEYYTDDECDNLYDAIIAYLEHAARCTNNEEHGLYMSAALISAHLFSYERPGIFYSSELKKKDMSIKDRIVHYALKLAEVKYIHGYHDERGDTYSYNLSDAVEEYVRLKDSEADIEQQQ